MGARRHGQEGTLAPPPPLWQCCKVFLCIGSYSKTLSILIIYALFSQPVIGFWRLRPQTPTGTPPTPTPLGDFCPETPNLPTPGKNPAGAHVVLEVLRHLGPDHLQKRTFQVRKPAFSFIMLWPAIIR